MSSTGSRQIKRPRVSLSCMVCRRRKVRCGREHPQCANCVRMKEKCLYNLTTHDELMGRADQLAVAAQDKSPRGLEPHMQELTWAHWVPGGTGNRIGPGDEPQSPSAGAPAACLQPRLSRGAKQAAMDHITMVHSEEATKLPAGQNTANEATIGTASVISESLASPPLTSRPDASTKQQNRLWGRNHLSLGRGSRARYISPAFWGFVAGNESISDDFFDDDRNADPELPPSYISSMGIARLLKSLPTKAVSDALLEVFFLAVWPLTPLVHRRTLRADYDEFWDWCRDSKNNLPPQKFRDDPTFFCLLFAVLYCGASAAPAASWTSVGLHGQHRETTIHTLKAAYEMSLDCCQHLEHATLNTLVCTLLIWPFLDWPREPMQEVVDVGTTVRLAQSMGLHRDGVEWPTLRPGDQNIRRRVWWHIVRLDVQSSISSGLPLCCGSEAMDAVGMIADICDKDIDDPGSLSETHSIAIIFAIGCAETTRLQSKIIAHLQSGRGLTREGVGELGAAVKEHQKNIAALITRIPSQGIPERGFIPSRLANVSLPTHPALYTDDATKPAVLGAWTRVMLTLLKFDIVILLQKSLLPPPDSSNPDACRAWTSMLQLCVSYFRILIPVYQSPAFSPYKWFHRTHVKPLQCLFLTLVYLGSFKDDNSTGASVARYYVDEIIEQTVALYQPTDSSSADHRSDPRSKAGRSRATLPLAIQTLVNLHSHLDSSATTPPPMAPGNSSVLSSTMPAGNDSSGLEAEFFACVTELSSSLIVQ
ncbi:hypothetical protein BJX62DRAFT_236596 [Aspergillus germanicus]